MTTAGEGPVTSEMLEVAQQLANTAAGITVPLFRTKLDVMDKGDNSPVTKADQGAEAAMRNCVEEAFPEHGIFGEEGGYTAGSGA